jgi:hypothetical protein
LAGPVDFSMFDCLNRFFHNYIRIFYFYYIVKFFYRTTLSSLLP